MTHLAPYGGGNQRYREVDRQEMASLMAADAPGTLPGPKVEALLGALDKAFPDIYLAAPDTGGSHSLLTVKGYLVPQTSLSIEMLGAGSKSGYQSCGTHERGPWPHVAADGKIVMRSKWTLSEPTGAQPNYLSIHADISVMGRDIEYFLHTIASADDYFYTRLSPRHDERGGPLQLGRARYVVCDGMRGLLDYIHVLKHGDI